VVGTIRAFLDCPRSRPPAALPSACRSAAGQLGCGATVAGALSPVVERSMRECLELIPAMLTQPAIGARPVVNRPAEPARSFCWAGATRTWAISFFSPRCCMRREPVFLTTCSLEQFAAQLAPVPDCAVAEQILISWPLLSQPKACP